VHSRITPHRQYCLPVNGPRGANFTVPNVSVTCARIPFGRQTPFLGGLDAGMCCCPNQTDDLKHSFALLLEMSGVIAPSRRFCFTSTYPSLIRPRRNQVAHVRWILIFASFTMPLHSLRIGQGEVNGVPKHAARLLHAAIPKAPPFGQFMGPNPAHPALGRFAPRIPPREGRDGGGVFARPMNKLGEGGPRFPPIPKETRKAAHCPAHSWCGMPLATRSSHTFLYPT
jgi:hypothetical protein